MEIKISRLQKTAIEAALASKWKTAIEINYQIIGIDDNNVDAYLGLGFAYLQEGDLQNAKKFYNKALKIDQSNLIARNNLDKISILLKKGIKTGKTSKDAIMLNPNTFMNVLGKTKVITLLNIGQADVLAELTIGEKVELKAKKRRIEVRNFNGEYIGALPDDISKRLAYFLEAKSKYTVIIKAATKNAVDIFICEDRLGAKVKNYISFPDNIQDDLKLFMSKDGDKNKDDDDDNDDDLSDTEHDDDEEDDEEMVDDIEQLATNEAQEDKDEYISHLQDKDDDDDEFEE